MKNILKSPWLPLALAFLALNLIVTQDGGQNAKSRLLAMRTFAETGAFRLDDHLRVTDDWSLAPNGHYYSNKAPGPILLGIPAFFLADKAAIPGEKGFRDERGLRADPGYLQSTFTSFVMQALPFALLALAIAFWLAQLGAAWSTQFFFLLTALFANTAALFMNSYFGHGFSALAQLAGLFFLLSRRYAWSGLFFSVALLSDYGFAAQLPALGLAIWWLRPAWKDLARFLAGGIPGAVAWVAYHGAIFGSPFGIASRFQNPVFLEQDRPLLWGMISLPEPAYLWELTFGMSRGLILSQPWMLWLVPAFLWIVWSRRANREIVATALFGFLSLAALLLMNASFNGWHGGATAGPRYLSGILPVLALLGAMVWQESGRNSCIQAAALLAVGLVFRALVYGGTLLAPNTPLWGYYLSEWGHRTTPILRFGIFFAVLGLGVYFSRRRLRAGLNFRKFPV